MDLPRYPEPRRRAAVPTPLGLLAVGVFLLPVGGCVQEPAEEDLLRLPTLALAVAVQPSSAGTSDALNASRLGTGSYQVPGYEGRILLRDGLWEDAASRAFAQLSDGLHALGDFDGDGATEAATVLTLGTGGTDVRVYLLGVGGVGGRVTQKAALLLGDRVQVRRLRNRDEAVEVNYLTLAPGDDPCCPTREVTRRFRIRNGNWLAR